MFTPATLPTSRHRYDRGALPFRALVSRRDFRHLSRSDLAARSAKVRRSSNLRSDVDARILHALTDDGAAAATTQSRPGTGHNGGPVFGLRAAWLRFARAIKLRRLAKVQVRVERKHGR
jgi:hypothetical protein